MTSEGYSLRSQNEIFPIQSLKLFKLLARGKIKTFENLRTLKSFRCPKFDGDAKQTLEIRVERKRNWKLGELGEVSFGMLKLGELGEVSFRIYKLGELGEVSFGMLKLGKLGELWNIQVG